MKIFVPFMVTACLVVAAACSRQNTAEEESLDAAIETSEELTGPSLEYDAAFARTMAERNLLQIQMGEMALAKAESEEVQDLAEKTITLHKTAQSELTAWAGSKGFVLPDELNKKSLLLYDKMAEQKGDDFDEAYCDYLVNDYQQDIRKLEWEIEKGSDAELQKWANEKIPVWKSHLEMAEQAEETADEKD